MGSLAAQTIVVGHGFSDAAAFPLPPPLVLLVSAALVAAAAAVSAQHTNPVPALARTIGPTVAFVLRIAAALLLAAIVVPATFGQPDVSDNPAPRLLFTVGWAGILLVSALVGPVWAKANPLRWAGTPQASGVELYRRVGVWPAVAALVVFSIAEQVLEPSPLVVLTVVALYVLAGGGGALVHGLAWFRVADPFETGSRMLGRLAPVGRRGRKVVARRVRAGVAATGSVPGTAAFLGVLIGANLYDALAPGHSTVVRLGLFALVVGATVAALSVAARPDYLAPALIPAAAGHVGAHYLAPLLVDTQIALIQASDPLGRGWDLFGIAGREPNATRVPIIVAQSFQLLLLVAGHALAMVVATDIAARHMSPRAAKAALFPLRAVVLASLLAGVYLRLVA